MGTLLFMTGGVLFAAVSLALWRLIICPWRSERAAKARRNTLIRADTIRLATITNTEKRAKIVARMNHLQGEL
jgi:hypothetical protein